MRGAGHEHADIPPTEGADERHTGTDLLAGFQASARGCFFPERDGFALAAQVADVAELLGAKSRQQKSRIPKQTRRVMPDPAIVPRELILLGRGLVCRFDSFFLPYRMN